ncbi:hypothetical protein DPMN_038862 [Dreissena polymorpha]|uniref:Uncharacterized protein n=1 Tax=Dreissena polymorpha TaxID=45954 RepID=A0A9D4RQR6_DREPO|nr:hypothetical protein DPMN_038862 [Dreissena polymorpha]
MDSLLVMKCARMFSCPPNQHGFSPCLAHLISMDSLLVMKCAHLKSMDSLLVMKCAIEKVKKILPNFKF